MKSQTLTPDYRQTRNRPATVAEGEEEHAEDDAGNADMNADDDACGGGFALLVFHTVARHVQHWGDTAQVTECTEVDEGRRWDTERVTVR